MEFTEELIKVIKLKYFELIYDDFIKYFAKEVANCRIAEAKPIISLLRIKYNWNRRHGDNYFNWTDDKVDILKQYASELGNQGGSTKFAKEYNITFDAAYNKLKLINRYSEIYTLQEGEQVVQIKDWENYYITNFGNILTKNVNGYKLLRASNLNGYKLIWVYKKGNKRSFLVHRLVGEYFIPNPNNKPCIDHIDTNRSNNHYTNLRWVTSEENMLNELTRLHLSIAHDGSSKLFTITIVDNETGELTKVTTMAALYRHFNLEYIPKYAGTLMFRGKTIIMSGEDNDEYYIGKMLRRGNTKEELILKVSNYSENREYIKYINSTNTDL